MAVQVSYPGVYIEEFAPGAPIEGVGTSTAAFLGPARYGDPNVPRKLFSWEGFLQAFGNPSGPTPPPGDDDYLWYGVRGFFENGGRICYVVRVSNALPDAVTLDDDAAAQTGAPPAQPAIRIAARVARNNAPNPITTAIAHTTAATTNLYRPATTLAQAVAKDAKVIDVASAADAAKFRPTDMIVITEPGVASETAVVTRIEGKLIRLESPLGRAYPTTTTTVGLANPVSDTTVLRLEDSASAAKLAAGSVIRLTAQGAATSIFARVKSVLAELGSAGKTWRVTLADGLGAGLSLANPVAVASQDFTLTIAQGGASTPYTELSMSPGHPRYFADVVKADPNGLVYADPIEPPNTTRAPYNRPKATAAAINLTGGASENLPALGATEYADALAALARIDDVNIVCAPGITDAGVQLKLIEHCERMQDRFAVLDSRRAAPVSGGGSVADQRAGVTSNVGYAALYYPWLRVPPAEGNRPLLVPPSGHVAGVYARIDGSRGVHKAPAGAGATLNGVLGVERLLSDAEHGDLNLTHGINIVRVFQNGGRAIVWGARTTAADRNWQYVNIRRLFLFLEESLQEGIRWAVFEPNEPGLWQKLKRSIRDFLRQQWRAGALFGNKEEEAFYVRIDEVLNPDSQRALGRLTIEIGVRPSYPAEFIVVRIGIWAGGGDVSES